MMNSKNDYLKEVESTLQQWAIRLAELSVEAKTAKPERRRDLQTLIDAIAEEKKFIELQIKEIKRSDDNWLNLKESVEGATKNIDKNYRSALAYMM